MQFEWGGETLPSFGRRIKSINGLYAPTPKQIKLALAGNKAVFVPGRRAVTTAYGLAQVIGPLYSVYFIQKYGSYDYALYLTAFIVLCGVLLLFFAKTIISDEQKQL